jgi:hypothetical protein
MHQHRRRLGRRRRVLCGGSVGRGATGGGSVGGEDDGEPRAGCEVEARRLEAAVDPWDVGGAGEIPGLRLPAARPRCRGRAAAAPPAAARAAAARTASGARVHRAQPHVAPASGRTHKGEAARCRSSKVAARFWREAIWAPPPPPPRPDASPTSARWRPTARWPRVRAATPPPPAAARSAAPPPPAAARSPARPPAACRRSRQDPGHGHHRLPRLRQDDASQPHPLWQPRQEDRDHRERVRQRCGRVFGGGAAII